MTGFIEHVRSLARPPEAAKSARDMRPLAHKRKMWVTVRLRRLVLDPVELRGRVVCDWRPARQMRRRRERGSCADERRPALWARSPSGPFHAPGRGEPGRAAAGF